MQIVLIFFIRTYQKSFSLFIGRSCRFYPSCSHYSIEAIQEFGCLKGLWMTVGRIIRCNPLNEGGIDHVIKPMCNAKQKHNHKH